MVVLKCFLISFFIIYCESVSLPCKDCAFRKTDLPVQQQKLLRCDYIKDHILKKLHLTEPPEIKLPKPPPNYLLVIAEMTQSETVLEPEHQLKTENILIYPKNEGLSCSKQEAYFCNRFEFSIPGHIIFENYLSADIWMHKTDNNTYRVYQVFKDNLENITKCYELNNTINVESSWIKYNTLGESTWLSNALDNVFVIEVIDDKGETHAKDNLSDTFEIPFLVIQVEVGNEKEDTRRKRSSTCVGNSPSCCKENFYLNFREIGWDNWIIHPVGYQANFCRGRCLNDLSNARSSHSTILFNFIDDNKDLAEEIGLSMCCTPSKMAPITIFYRNEEGLIYQKTIENMRVETCDCA